MEPDESITYTFGVDTEMFPSSTNAAERRLQILGHHIKHLSLALGVADEEAAELALQAADGFEIED